MVLPSDFLRSLAAVVGVLWLSWLLLRILKSLAVNFNAFFLAPWGITRMNLKKQGAWAVVTGGSEGIGWGYALELARQGLNVVIISRSEEKLKKAADEIREKHGREVRIITADFSKGLEIYPNIGEQLKDLDIGVLMNNVGISTSCPDTIANSNDMELHKVTEVNNQAMIQMTKLVLPKMLEKKRGVIVNMSSSFGVLSIPMVITYCATKSFIISFSNGLRKEYSSKGIIVQCAIPLFVMTPLVRTLDIDHKPTFLVPDEVSFTRAAVATIGIVNHTRGCVSHTLQGALLDILPDQLVDAFFLPVFKKTRDTFYKKLEKSKEE